MTNPQRGRRWDLFCSVVDNYGDIGVCWRLARQLVAEFGLEVRLWVDDLHSFQRLLPGLDTEREQQSWLGVRVCRWREPFETEPSVAEVVIEAFACTLPASYLAAMAACKRMPVWINLEYLSAEAWVGECHGLASPHPQLPLCTYFFFPGFGAETGGLLRERELLERRRAFQCDGAGRADFWRGLDLPQPANGELRLSLFSYGCAELPALLRCWSESPRPVFCLLPEGRQAEPVAHWFGQAQAEPGAHWQRGNLQVRVMPFLEQDHYDRLLWACDLNLVRGEDSFVRAQWAGRPLVWQLYRQQENAHRTKLEAFLERYTAGLAPEPARALCDFWRAWDREAGVVTAWPGFIAHYDALMCHAEGWIERQKKVGDLATNLVQFCRGCRL
ncbi:elongation factor P maturation arginine rhamnosyltransferase EarP [Zobellella maritima]|uniref:elongation factor P maturation arginine rhamnosyltransferase EarP n=1 Tax=Zobellella maritima TaxID=2059725 RepID=UPI000E30219B|nr:elongation factor P maturation arginine rhamnosyltransferase EarP [Zobellella maritima]